MPEVFRLPLRMDCKGIDLVSPIDKMPPGSFPYLFNVRIIEEGRLEARPGYQELIKVGTQPNSIRRLNDPSRTYAPSGYTYIGGGGPNLYAGVESAYAAIDTGYSGDPLSLIPFRPDQSPEAWMYVYDRSKLAKVRPDGVIRSIGVAPPTDAPLIEYGVPADVDTNTGQSTSGWAASGVSTGLALADRTNSSAPTITSILYNDGVGPGWCCINPNITQPFWMGERMKVILNSGGGNQEEVAVRNILPAIQSTTIAAIQYDAGSVGLCSIVMTNNPSGLERNSLVNLGGTEVVRILEAVISPTGITYSIRCSTTATHSAGESITGLISWYVYTAQVHVAAETISSQYISLSHAATGVGAANFTGNINDSAANGRPVSISDDYLHISIFLQNPQNVTDIQLLFTLDATPNFSFDNPGNSIIWELTQTQLDTQGSSGDSWVEVVVPISSGTRSGSDFTRTLTNITGVSIQITTTGACAWGFDWWYLFGTYGPVIQPNSPTGYVYQSRNRDSSTGAHSVPGPQTRYELFPLRESVIITPDTSNQVGVDELDIYRQGGTISTSLYVGTVENNPSAPNSFTDGLPDSQVLKTNQAPDLASFQPWPLLVAPWQGEAMVIGTSVIWVSGPKFDVNLLSNTAINLDGNVFLTYGQPKSDTHIELTQDAGYLASSNFVIASPTLAAQPLAYAFGPLEGPFAPVIFALGDPLNGGFLYFTNPADADSASDSNNVEESTPSSDLVSGQVWNGLVFAGSREDVFCTRYSYLATIGASNNTTFQWARVASPSGMWSRWSTCSTPIGVAFLGRDGIYICTDSQAVSITDEKLYSLFPHDGVPAKAVNSGSNIILPVDMTNLNLLRMSYCDEAIRFSYVDTGGNFNTLIYEIYKKRWLLNNYANAITAHYLVEPSSSLPNQQQILMLSLDTKSIMTSGSNADVDKPINSIVLTPSMDSGDERAQKLYVDAMVIADGNGTMEVAAAYDYAQSFSPVLNVPCDGAILQTQLNLASQSNLALHLNAGYKIAWTGGPDGPRLYAVEFSGFLQPYLSKFFVTQYTPFSFPGWKHVRRLYPALISVRPILFTIRTQDGRQYGPYTIPSTNGQYRQFPQMLDSGIKDLAFSIQLDGGGFTFALFPDDFTLEVKEWQEETYIDLAVFKA